MSVTHEPVPMTSSATASEGQGLLAFLKDFHNRTILFRAGNFIFVTYGLIAAIAFGTTTMTAFWYNASTGVDIGSLAKFYLLFMLPAVLLGARLFSLMLEWRQLFVEPVKTLIKPGYMLHGGVFGGTVALLVYGLVGPTTLLNLVDTWGLVMPLGEAIIRLGCYVYGCCWGKPTHSHFGVAYTSEHSKVVRCAPHLHGVKIHPAQIYALIAHGIQFVLFLVLINFRTFDGMIAGLYMLTHPIIRIFLERFRQDDRGKLVGKLTHTNLYSFVQMLFGVAFIVAGYAIGHLTPVSPVSWFGMFSNSTAVLFALLVGVVAALAFGLHYKKVGSWTGDNKSANAPPNISHVGVTGSRFNAPN